MSTQRILTNPRRKKVGFQESQNIGHIETEQKTKPNKGHIETRRQKIFKHWYSIVIEIEYYEIDRLLINDPIWFHIHQAGGGAPSGSGARFNIDYHSLSDTIFQ